MITPTKKHKIADCSTFHVDIPTSKKKKHFNGLFPTGTIGRLIRSKVPHMRIGKTAPVFMAQVMAYLCTEVLELSG